MRFTLDAETALVVLVIVVSALGGFIQAIRSLTWFVGTGGLARRWIAWYVFRIFGGVPLALIFYFAVRGGVLAADTRSDQINAYGVAAIAGLVGLFADGALTKLRGSFAPGEATPAEAEALRDRSSRLFRDSGLRKPPGVCCSLRDARVCSRGRAPNARVGAPTWTRRSNRCGAWLG